MTVLQVINYIQGYLQFSGNFCGFYKAQDIASLSSNDSFDTTLQTLRIITYYVLLHLSKSRYDNIHTYVH